MYIVTVISRLARNGFVVVAAGGTGARAAAG